jgi:zinc protease
MTSNNFILVCLSILFLSACSRPDSQSEHQPEPAAIEQESEFRLDFEKYTLKNGLDVIFHVDRSDPVVAVSLTFHVGSARERPGRTGFAHLFEHLLFLESENLGKGGLDELSGRIGGAGADGSTSRDQTNYYQTVPKDALEKMLWAEADKLGYFINTVTEEVLAKEKEVVKNEKRQRVDNQPYGHNDDVIGRNLYPSNHPYHWQVIGSLGDLQNATLEDVKTFYEKWYAPNNATLVVAGDIDVSQTKEWVDKYFSELSKGGDIKPQPKQPVTVEVSRRLKYEDNFARLPQLTLTWPTVPAYHRDAYALEILAELLATGKKAPLNRVIIDEKKLAPYVTAYNYNSELAGEFGFEIRAYEGTPLETVQTALNQGLELFEISGIDGADLDRIKARIETAFYTKLGSVLGKGFQLAHYNILANDPGFASEDLRRWRAVSEDDVLRVYRKYIKSKNYIATSFVPKEESDLALENSTPALIVNEQIIEGAEAEIVVAATVNFTPTPSSFDRTVEPPYGASMNIPTPKVWQTTLSNQMLLMGIEDSELPLTEFTLVIDGGLLQDDFALAGTASLLADLMMKGTATRTTIELEEAIDSLGATLSIYSDEESLVIHGQSLTRNYPALMELTTDILLEPRWDALEFNLAKQKVLSDIEEGKGDPNTVASRLYRELLYGKAHVLGIASHGNAGSVSAIKITDLKDYYKRVISPMVARFHIVGDISQPDVERSLEILNKNWLPMEVERKQYPLIVTPSEPSLYFYDIPGAKQSVFRFGYLALAETDELFYPALVANHILGGGGFSSRLTQQLREAKGYTYSIGSRFSGSRIPGPFTIRSNIRTNVTFAAAALVLEIMRDYPATFSDKDLETTRGFLLKSSARNFETHAAKIRMLEKLSNYGWQPDYIQKRLTYVKELSVSDVAAVATRHLDPNKMTYLIVGDAATQLKGLTDLGLGEPILLEPK